MNRKFYFAFDSCVNAPNSMKLGSNNAIFVKVLEPRNKMLRILRRIHIGKKVNKYVCLPGKRIWGMPIAHVCSDKTVEHWIVFSNTMALCYTLKWLMRQKRSGNIHFVLMLQDDLRSPNGIRSQDYINSGIFDYIFTFDAGDASRNGLQFSYIPFIPRSIPDHLEVPIDLYYAGFNDGRLDIQHGIFHSLLQHNIAPFFRITKVNREDRVATDKIIYNRIVPYDQIVEELLTSNCILEVLKSTQTAATLRYYEAVCYNKKLLTNNKNVVNLPFYNPEYIHVFVKPEDIDWEWVKERIPVDYHYDGRFSPEHMVERIIKLEKQKEAQGGGEKE